MVRSKELITVAKWIRLHWPTNIYLFTLSFIFFLIYVTSYDFINVAKCFFFFVMNSLSISSEEVVGGGAVYFILILLLFVYFYIDL